MAGDSEAFGELFRRHRDRLWAVALRTVCDPEEAADALQDAMVSAFRRAGDFRGDSAVTTWLHRIVVNACLDRLRRRAARPAVSGRRRAGTRGPGWRTTPIPPRATDTRLDVDAALRILPPQQRAALVLVDMLGFSVDRRRGHPGHLPGHGEEPLRPGPGPAAAPTWRTCDGIPIGDEAESVSPAQGGDAMRGQMAHLDSDVLAEFRAGSSPGAAARDRRAPGRLRPLHRPDRQLAEVSRCWPRPRAPVMPDGWLERLDTVLAAELARRDEAERAGAGQSARGPPGAPGGRRTAAGSAW